MATAQVLPGEWFASNGAVTSMRNSDAPIPIPVSVSV